MFKKSMSGEEFRNDYPTTSSANDLNGSSSFYPSLLCQCIYPKITRSTQNQT